MKYAVALLSLVVILLVGCEYEAPLTKEHNIAIDSAVLGLWELIPEEGEEFEDVLRMLILKYSETEYLVRWPMGQNEKDTLYGYLRCYPIKIGDVSCIQLQVIGTDYGPPEEDWKNLFYVASYRLTNDELEIKWINTDLLKKNLKTTKALRQSFLKHKDNKELFTNLGRFRKIEK